MEPPIDQLQVRLVDERRGVEREVALPPLAQAMGELAQFLVDERKERVERGPVAALELAEETMDGGLFVAGHDAASGIGGSIGQTIGSGKRRSDRFVRLERQCMSLIPEYRRWAPVAISLTSLTIVALPLP